jgi:hypothetical protein
MKSMSDHNFEQKVQHSLEQLKLRPSVAVWAEVEKNIRKDKRRRRMIMWLPVCLLFLGAGGYFMLKDDHAASKQSVAVQTTTPNTSATDNSSTQTKDNTVNPVTETVKDVPPSSSTTAITPQPGEKTITPAETKHVQKQASETTIKEQPAIVKADVLKPARDQQKKFAQPKPRKERKPAREEDQLVALPSSNRQEPPVKQVDNTAIVKDSSNSTEQQAIAINTTTVADSLSANNTTDTAMAIATPAPDSASMAGTVAVDSVQKNIELVKQPATPALATTAKKELPLQRPKRGRWQWGVQTEAGFTGVTQNGLLGGLFSFLNNSSEVNKVADVANAPFQNTVGNGAAVYAPQFPRPINGPSEITMGPSISIGGFVQRTLSRRFTLSVGVQYAYLSTRTIVGSKVNTSRAVNQANYSARLVDSYYDANNTEDYTNRYHFIEIPVLLHTKLNKSMRSPITWDLGLSVARMVGTTALHYDGLGGVYYKDNSLFNKTQWVAATGFNIGLFQQSKHPLAIGPSVRYNMTNMLKKEYNVSQHLWSVGLKATVLLKK